MGVVNQFGTNQLVIGDAILLGVPTQKAPFGPPFGLDHFKCYAAQGSPANATVDLRDQFHFEPQVVVLNPDWYCNPARKRYTTARSSRSETRTSIWFAT